MEIKFDPGDLSAIYVWSPIHRGGDWIRVEAVDQEYTRGMTYWKHKVVRKYVSRRKWEASSANFRKGKHEIQQVIENDLLLTKQARNGRKKEFRYKNNGVRPVPGTGLQVVPSQTDPEYSSLPGQPAVALGKTQHIAIGEAAPASPTPDETSVNPTPAASSNKPRRSRKNQTTQGVPAPAPTPRQWDMTDWGADYEMPKPGHLTVVKGRV